MRQLRGEPQQFRKYLELLFSKASSDGGNGLSDQENSVLFLDLFLTGFEYSFTLKEQLECIGDGSYVEECLCAVDQRKAAATVGLMRMATAADDGVAIPTLNRAFQQLLPSIRSALIAYARRLECETSGD